MKPATLSFEPISLQHPQHRLVGAAVERPVERGDGARRRAVGIGLGGADAAHHRGRAVLLVVGVQDEQHLERLLQDRVHLVAQLGALVHHLQEVAAVAELVVRVDVGHAHRVAVGEGRERRDLGDQPVDLLLPQLGVADVLGLRIEGAERGDRRGQHAHRVRVVAEAARQLLDVLVHEGVARDALGPRLELRSVGSSPWSSRYAVSRYVLFSASCSIG